MPTPIRGNPNALRLRQEHALYIFNEGDLAVFIKEEWYRHGDYWWLELFRGHLYGIKRDRFIDEIQKIFATILRESLEGKGDFMVTDERRIIRIDEHNVMAPRVLVHHPDAPFMLAPKDVVLVVDFVTGPNEGRILSGRRLYKRHGIRNHWMIDVRRNFIEVAGIDLPDAAEKGPIAYRFEADRTVPIAIDGVSYGNFKLQDVFTT